MPDHVNQRIARLCELVEAGLSEENLDKMVQECGSLAQDSTQVLAFFVLKNIFAELSHTLQGEAVEVTRHQELIAGITEKTTAMLRKLAADTPVSLEEVEELVRTHVVNRNLFRS